MKSQLRVTGILSDGLETSGSEEGFHYRQNHSIVERYLENMLEKRSDGMLIPMKKYS